MVLYLQVGHDPIVIWLRLSRMTPNERTNMRLARVRVVVGIRDRSPFDAEVGGSRAVQVATFHDFTSVSFSEYTATILLNAYCAPASNASQNCWRRLRSVRRSRIHLLNAASSSVVSTAIDLSHLFSTSRPNRMRHEFFQLSLKCIAIAQ